MEISIPNDIRYTGIMVYDRKSKSFVQEETDLWKFVKRRLNRLSLKQNIILYSRVFCKDISNKKNKIDVLLKIPDIIDKLADVLTYNEIEIIKMLSYGCTYDEICKELGYANRSSINGKLRDIKKRIMEIL